MFFIQIQQLVSPAYKSLTQYQNYVFCLYNIIMKNDDEEEMKKIILLLLFILYY